MVYLIIYLLDPGFVWMVVSWNLANVIFQVYITLRFFIARESGIPSSNFMDELVIPKYRSSDAKE